MAIQRLTFSLDGVTLNQLAAALLVFSEMGRHVCDESGAPAALTQEFVTLSLEQRPDGDREAVVIYEGLLRNGETGGDEPLAWRIAL